MVKGMTCAVTEGNEGCGRPAGARCLACGALLCRWHGGTRTHHVAADGSGLCGRGEAATPVRVGEGWRPALAVRVPQVTV